MTRNSTYDIGLVNLTGEMITRHSGEDFWSMGAFCDLDFLLGIIWELKQNIDLVVDELNILDEPVSTLRKQDHQEFADNVAAIKEAIGW